MDHNIPSIKDNDYTEKTEFESGAVRDVQVDKGRFDLLPLSVMNELFPMDDPVCESGFLGIERFIMTKNPRHLLYTIGDFSKEGFDGDYYEMINEVALHFKAGAEKYGYRNWEKGIPIHSYIDSAVRHYVHFRMGHKDERHDRAYVWNLMCAIWTCQHHKNLYDEFCKVHETINA